MSVARYLEKIVDKRERIVSEEFALGFLHLLRDYLLENESLSFKQEVALGNHWLWITLPVSINIHGQFYRIELPFKVFVVESSKKTQFILIEQFVNKKFGLDFDLDTIDFASGFKLVYLDDTPSLSLVFSSLGEYQQAMESLVMACYDVLFEDYSATPSQSMLS